MRTKQRIYEDYREDEEDGESGNAVDPAPNGHVIKGGGSSNNNGYTRLAQSDDSAVGVNLLLDGEDED